MLLNTADHLRFIGRVSSVYLYSQSCVQSRPKGFLLLQNSAAKTRVLSGFHSIDSSGFLHHLVPCFVVSLESFQFGKRKKRRNFLIQANFHIGFMM